MSEVISYRKAGVNIDAGNELVDRLKKVVPLTDRPGVIGTLGGFGGCFDLSALKSYEHPILVSGTDGVGTKLRLAIDWENVDTIGIDLVAMCVNDIVVMGAEPLYFLDYYATGQLNVDVAEAVVKGIVTGCQSANTALIGGETAEMPGMYQKNDFDLAGFTVGIIEKADLIDGSTIQPEDVLIALPSSGPHANGYSLIRHIITHVNATPDTSIGDGTLQTALLAPTRIYVKSLLALAEKGLMKGAAHITGGGFTENVPRMLPDNCAAALNMDAWQLPAIFEWLQKSGDLSAAEMRRTFNCGVGMVICVAKSEQDKALAVLREHGEAPFVIGHVVTRTTPEQAVLYSDGS